MILFDERATSALNRMRPSEVVTTTGIERGREKLSKVAVRAWGSSGPAPDSEQRIDAESESTSKNEKPMLHPSYVGPTSTSGVSV